MPSFSATVCQPHRLCAHLAGFFQVQRELLFMVSLLMLGIEASHAELAVVLDLQRVKAAQCLHLAVETAEALRLGGEPALASKE